MKKINDTIVQGSPHSRIRYERATSLCSTCAGSAPPDIFYTFATRSPFHLGFARINDEIVLHGQCYVCEEIKHVTQVQNDVLIDFTAYDKKGVHNGDTR